jgi:hypothetical protein
VIGKIFGGGEDISDALESPKAFNANDANWANFTNLFVLFRVIRHIREIRVKVCHFKLTTTRFLFFAQRQEFYC